MKSIYLSFLVALLLFTPQVSASSDLSGGFIFSRMMVIGAWSSNATNNTPPLCDLHGTYSKEVWCKNRINETIEEMKKLHVDAVLLNLRQVYMLAERYPNVSCAGYWCGNSKYQTFNDLDERARWGYLNWTLKRFADEGINAGIIYPIEYTAAGGALSGDQANAVIFGLPYTVPKRPGLTSDRIDISYPEVREFWINMTAWLATSHPDLKGIKIEEPGYWMSTGTYPPGDQRAGHNKCEYYGNCESWSPYIVNYVEEHYGYTPTQENWTGFPNAWGTTQQSHMMLGMEYYYNLLFEGIRNNITRYYPDFYLFGMVQRYDWIDGGITTRSTGINASKWTENKWIDILSGENGGNYGGYDKIAFCNEIINTEKYGKGVLVTNGVGIKQSGIVNNYSLDQINYVRTCRPNNFEFIFEWRFVSLSTKGDAEIKSNINTWLQANPPPPYAATTVSTPTFSPLGGNYSSGQSVSISTLTSGATIRYTKDGTIPTESSPIYSSPITISANSTLKARAWKTGLNASGITTATYTIGTEVFSPIVVNISQISSIKIDGDLNDWAGISGVSFNSTSGKNNADNTATAKAAWNDNYLFFAFDVKDTNLQAVATSRDGAISRDDEIEVYIDTLNDGGSLMMPDDYHFLVNLNNVIGDQKGTGGKGSIQDMVNWNSSMISTVKIIGTRENANDVDIGYKVEIAIPWSDIGGEPAKGTTIGLDLAVGDRDNEIDGYQAFDWSNISGTWAYPDKWGHATLASGINPPYNYDFNGDGVVNREDLAIIGIALIYDTPTLCPGSDVNGDGICDVFDLVLVSNSIN